MLFWLFSGRIRNETSGRQPDVARSSVFFVSMRTVTTIIIILLVVTTTIKVLLLPVITTIIAVIEIKVCLIVA